MTIFSLSIVRRMLNTAIPTFITVITKDKDRSVSMATLQSLNEVLKSVKSLIVDEHGYPDGIANAARTVLMQKVCSIRYALTVTRVKLNATSKYLPGLLNI